MQAVPALTYSVDAAMCFTTTNFPLSGLISMVAEVEERPTQWWRWPRRHESGRVTVLDRPGLASASCGCYRVVRNKYDRMLGPPLPKA